MHSKIPLRSGNTLLCMTIMGPKRPSHFILLQWKRCRAKTRSKQQSKQQFSYICQTLHSTAAVISIMFAASRGISSRIIANKTKNTDEIDQNLYFKRKKHEIPLKQKFYVPFMWSTCSGCLVGLIILAGKCLTSSTMIYFFCIKRHCNRNPGMFEIHSVACHPLCHPTCTHPTNSLNGGLRHLVHNFKRRKLPYLGQGYFKLT